jgi:hypothetical protein
LCCGASGGISGRPCDLLERPSSFCELTAVKVRRADLCLVAVEQQVSPVPHERVCANTDGHAEDRRPMLQ